MVKKQEMDHEATDIYYTIFVTHHLYYIPQFTPIARELVRRGKKILFLLLGLDAPAQNEIAKNFCTENNFPWHFYDKKEPSLKCKFMIHGANSIPEINVSYQYLAHVIHGIGTKAGYYTEAQNKNDIRFVEGPYRVDKIRELFPDAKSKLFNVGFAKLDEAFTFSETDKRDLIERMNLDHEKKTLLYAPTFYPSSVDNMPEDFPEGFQDYNIVIKPHFFSFAKKGYRHHVRKFRIWEAYPNVYLAKVEEFNLVPFMAIADIMVSDESSAIFEFAALNKPVIINRNVYFRWAYRVFKRKIRKRMDANMDIFKDVATPVYDFESLRQTVSHEIAHPETKEKVRKHICGQIVGVVDGKASKRIADILETIR